jgi:CDP-diacylglycerol--glycerol-3-phosphate 3-phosphatidyltransferase
MKKELSTIFGIGLTLLALFSWLGPNWLFKHSAWRYWMFSSLIWSSIYLYVFSRLHLNRLTSNSPLYAELGWGNRISLLRGLMLAMTGGFLFWPQAEFFDPRIPASFYTLAAILDGLDGYIARFTRHTSLLGSQIDIQLDALGLVLAPLLAIEQERIHPSYLLLSAAFYVYQLAISYRQHLQYPVYPVPENPLRRTLAGFQMGFVACALWPWLAKDLSRIAGIAFMLPVLFGFVLDWCVLCGQLSHTTYQRFTALSAQFLQPLLRLFIVISLLFYLPSSDNYLITAMQVVCGLMILVGFFGRIASLLLLTLITWQLDTPILNITSIFAISWVLLLGTGRYSITNRGEHCLEKYHGG